VIKAPVEFRRDRPRLFNRAFSIPVRSGNERLQVRMLFEEFEIFYPVEHEHLAAQLTIR